MVNDSIIFFPWNCLFTVWKSKNFSSVWILREINSADEKNSSNQNHTGKKNPVKLNAKAVTTEKCKIFPTTQLRSYVKSFFVIYEPRYFHEMFAKKYFSWFLQGKVLTDLSEKIDLTKYFYDFSHCTSEARFYVKLVLINVAYTVWKNKKFTARLFFSSNQFTAKVFSKTLIWRNFCKQTVAAKFHNFHTLA